MGSNRIELENGMTAMTDQNDLLDVSPCISFASTIVNTWATIAEHDDAGQREHDRGITVMRLM